MMLKRLLVRIAERVQDTDWLRAMRHREVQARQSLQEMQGQRQSRRNPISDTAFPPHTHRRRS